MRFELAGFVAEMHVLTALLGSKIPAIRIGDELGFAAVSKSIAQARLGIQAPPEPGFKHLSRPLSERALTASERGRIVFIEAHFIDSLGEQAAVGWEAGHAAVGPLFEGHFGAPGRSVPPISDWPINRALRFLGVVAKPGADEFDTVRFGRHHRIERWLDADARTPVVTVPRLDSPSL